MEFLLTIRQRNVRRSLPKLNADLMANVRIRMCPGNADSFGKQRPQFFGIAFFVEIKLRQNAAAQMHVFITHKRAQHNTPALLLYVVNRVIGDASMSNEAKRAIEALRRTRLLCVGTVLQYVEQGQIDAARAKTAHDRLDKIYMVMRIGLRNAGLDHGSK